ncbi:uncharacterized protein LTHEOB_3658 [Lasiodiplodia theobromae]|uniref:uncharacterized protein n=1 Tax=Lasiodiplodia theobromae TaxID=45133 RepID=UPI0015C30E80|nr:uncharacterized protein LTHEOB_3658 [Lasiodiplodia theobromae]KAF4534045.1 hypothetical protein LTHEOB_3658 [Lasiodiplodia theobromae]
MNSTITSHATLYIYYHQLYLALDGFINWPQATLSSLLQFASTTDFFVTKIPCASSGAGIQLVGLDAEHITSFLEPQFQFCSQTVGPTGLSEMVGNRMFPRDGPAGPRRQGNILTSKGFDAMRDAQMMPTLASMVDHVIAEMPPSRSLRQHAS